jgi:hypothetical protein
MRLSLRSIVPGLSAATLVIGLLGLSACSRNQSATDSLTGPGRDGSTAFDGGGGGATIASITLTPTTVAGGASSAGRVTLDRNAPAGGSVVTLRSSSTAATVPASVSVAAGARSATFSATTRAVTANTTARISGSLGGVTRSVTLNVNAGAAPPPVAVNPCVSLTGLSGTVTATSAAVVQFRVNRTRVEVTGDVAAGTINRLGACASNATPAVTFVSGTATLSRGTVRSFTFGAAATGAALGEAGVIVATDAGGNVLEIIWPGLAGLGAGAPILRFQAQSQNGLNTGDVLTCTMTFVARAPDGTTATFTATGANMVVPALK